MIVPARRLLFCYAVTIPPLTILAVMVEDAVLPAVSVGAVFMLLALLDAIFACTRLRDINVSMPEIIRATKGRAGSIGLELTFTAGRRRILRIGLPFPPEITSPDESFHVMLPEDVQSLGLNCPFTPLMRGLFHLDACHLETSSLLGLWSFRGMRHVSCEIRVYPDLKQERRGLEALFLRHSSSGMHIRRQQGKGREFERLRAYIPGDGYDEIHWKATAKYRYPISKVFQIERTREIYVIMDISRLSARPSGVSSGSNCKQAQEAALNNGDSQLERFIAASLVLCLATRKQGDLFGIITFSDTVHDFLRAGGGNAHYSACRERIFNLYPRMVNPDFEELGTFIRLKLRRRALIMILTSLDDPVLAESFLQSIKLIRRHHLIMVNMFRPLHIGPVFSNPDVASMDGIYDALSGHNQWHHLQELERTMSRQGVQFALFDNETLCVDLVSRYINIKQRQLL